MQHFGYNSYVVCGDDWGSTIGTYIEDFKQHCLYQLGEWKHYVQSAPGHYLSSWFMLDCDEKDHLIKDYNGFAYLKFFWFDGGYLYLQATKPDTVGYALNDSPLGLAAYILEKWSCWNNNQTEIDGSINSGLHRFTLYQLLSNIMLYWTTGTITSSMSIYFGEISATFSGYDCCYCQSLSRSNVYATTFCCNGKTTTIFS